MLMTHDVERCYDLTTVCQRPEAQPIWDKIRTNSRRRAHLFPKTRQHGNHYFGPELAIEMNV